jgi:hypothetical protein
MFRFRQKDGIAPLPDTQLLTISLFAQIETVVLKGLMNRVRVLRNVLFSPRYMDLLWRIMAATKNVVTIAGTTKKAFPIRGWQLYP